MAPIETHKLFVATESCRVPCKFQYKNWLTWDSFVRIAQHCKTFSRVSFCNTTQIRTSSALQIQYECLMLQVNFCLLYYIYIYIYI